MPAPKVNKSQKAQTNKSASSAKLNLAKSVKQVKQVKQIKKNDPAKIKNLNVNSVDSKSSDDKSENKENLGSNYDKFENLPYSLKIEDPEYVMTSEDIRLRIMNDNNIYITKQIIDDIFKRVGFNYKVKDLKNFQIAMIHESYIMERLTDNKTAKLIREFDPIDPSRARKAIPLQTESYERLEFLGDSVIHYVLAKYLYDRYPEMHQGDLTLTRSKIEKKESLSKYSKELGLHKYVMIGYSVEQVNGRITNPSITEDIFESLVGALLLEAGIILTEEFIIKTIEYLEDIPEIIRTHNNYKDQLMQYFHKVDSKCRHDLKYIDEDFEDKNGKRKYHTRVYDKMTGQYLGEGQGRSKRSAQQNSAKDALLKLGLIGSICNSDNTDDYFEVDFDIDEEILKQQQQQ